VIWSDSAASQPTVHCHDGGDLRRYDIISLGLIRTVTSQASEWSETWNGHSVVDAAIVELIDGLGSRHRVDGTGWGDNISEVECAFRDGNILGVAKCAIEAEALMHYQGSLVLGPNNDITMINIFIIQEFMAPQKSAWHGPYYQWTTKRRGKTVSVSLTEIQAEKIQVWLNNHREFRKLTREMERHSLKMTGREIR
jgi:hypothetical protein